MSNERQHGLRVTVTVFIPFDRTKPNSMAAAAGIAEKICNGEGLSGGAVVEKAMSIPAARPMPVLADLNKHLCSQSQE